MESPERQSVARLELWGGVEATCNRVGDVYFDQLRWSGHERRLEDLDRIAALGIRVVRQPVLWERVAPEGLSSPNWSWSDERLERLGRLGVEPIVGLLHHGSGPRYTNLLDPEFPEKLAVYAGAVASRYRSVRRYTPVNEPLTTARFSALYGHWFPHARDDRSFVRALYHQCRGTVLAMDAIRRYRPDAELVQTEDLGTAHGSTRVAEQVAFENLRRWLTWDLLAGKVDEHHPMEPYLRRHGLSARELDFFRDGRGAPSILGINHYVTSDRYLDHRIDRYPSPLHGGNGHLRYVDVEAVRVKGLEVPSVSSLLATAYARYHIPVAVTEVHLGCTREEQCRWFVDVWQECETAAKEGTDVRAVTAWALLGSFDWNSLVTRPSGYYEAGAFDVRAGEPRPTALAGVLSEIAEGKCPKHPTLEEPGWWARPERWRHEAETPAERLAEAVARCRSRRSVVVLGANGSLMHAMAQLAATRGLTAVALDPRWLECGDRAALRTILERFHPWAVVCAEGVSSSGAKLLAEVCAEMRVALLAFSSAHVFDGLSDRPYVESSSTSPSSELGRRHAESESCFLGSYPATLVVRPGPIFAPGAPDDFLTSVVHYLRRGEALPVPSGKTAPALVTDVVQASLDLLVDGASGIWHLAGADAVSWEEVVSNLARRLGVRADVAVRRDAPVPCVGHPWLASERHAPLPSWEGALQETLDAPHFMATKELLYA